MHTIDITSLSIVNPPYLVYVCDFFGNQCELVATVNIGDPIPIMIILPSKFDSAPAITVKFVDQSGCETSEIYYCS